MSGIIKTLVLQKRYRDLDQAERERFIAEARGPAGLDGPKGDIGLAPAHEWHGSKLRFQNPDGQWGKFTELKGPPGKDAKDGGSIYISRGSSGTDLDELPAGAGNPVAVAVRLQDGGWVHLAWADFVAAVAASSTGANAPPANAVTTNGSPITVGGQYVTAPN